MKMGLNQYEKEVQHMSNEELKDELLYVLESNPYISRRGIGSGALFGVGFGTIISALKMSADTLITDDFIKVYFIIGILAFGAGAISSILTTFKEDDKNKKLEILSKYVDSEEEKEIENEDKKTYLDNKVRRK